MDPGMGIIDHCARHSWRWLWGEVWETAGGEALAIKGEMAMIKVLNGSY
jgi:hypothetical protein